MNDSDSSLSELRAQIDDIDLQLLVALKKRWDVLAKIAETKHRARSTAVDSDRETEIRGRWRSTAEALKLPTEVAAVVLDAVLSQSRHYVAERLDAR